MIVKKGIASRLRLYFVATLLLLSLFIGIIFMVLFQKHTIDVHKKELEIRAEQIGDTVSSYMEGRKTGMRGSYINFIDDIAGSDAWIVDRELNVLTTGRGKQNSFMDSSKTLPENAEEIVKKVLNNQVAFSQDFSSLLSEKSLTVGVPILASDGEVLGAVLLHSPIIGTQEGLMSSFMILGVSVLFGLIISTILATIFSVKFTKPLYKMTETAKLLSNGNYSARTEVMQKDEIGQLALTIDNLAEDLEIASKESERFEKMRSDFVANVSHELRTPVTVIRGFLEAIVDGVIKSPERVDEIQRQLLSETKYLQRLVTDLLELSRLQSLDFSIERENINFCDIINDVERSLRRIAEEKSIKIEKDVSVDYYKYVGDYGRLKQMITTIIENAIKFSDRNSIVIISFNSEGVLKIKDFGRGIVEEDIPYVFEKFHRSRSEANKEGTGLGLSIAKQIANRHNIEIEVLSGKGQGTEFILRLSQSK